MVVNLSDHIVKNAPSTVYYVPNFVTADEEQQILTQITENTPIPKWNSLNGRRCINYGGIVGNKSLIVCDDIPKWLHVVMASIDEVAKTIVPDSDMQTNHVLINEYAQGQGILPHVDGPAYRPFVFTVSLGAPTSLQLMNEEREVAGEMYLERRSLVVLTEEAYEKYLHGIAEVTADTLSDGHWNVGMVTTGSVGDTVEREGTRYSLTVRQVGKVSNIMKRMM